MSKVLCISGVIGAGKSTFINNYANYLRNTYNIEVDELLEYVEGNRLLEMMYDDPRRWTYTSQICFLVDKLKSFRKIRCSNSKISLIERSYEELKIFVDVQYKYGNIKFEEYRSFVDLYEELMEYNILPDYHTIFIRIPYEESLRRIRLRGRLYENIENNEFYFKALYEKYVEFYKKPNSAYIIDTPITIDTFKKIDSIFLPKEVY